MGKRIIREASEIKFKRAAPEGFLSEVRRRVEAFFARSKLQRNADASMWLKTIFLIVANFALYGAILSNEFGFMGVMVLFILFGYTTSFICINIIHDVLHGSLFKNKTWNKCLGYLFDLQGFSSFNWTLTHNNDHHTFTNIAGIDKDIDKMIFLRLAPTDGYYPFHRFQHWYALPLYTLTTLNWAHYSDYVLMWDYWKKGRASNIDAGIFLFFKALYIALYIVIPIIVVNLPWWQTFMGYVLMQMFGGFLAAIVFQLAHVVEGVEYPLPDERGHMENIWVMHEMKTTSNFASDSPLTSHLFGGLNFQIEHHLFPHVSHVHYHKISPIVRQTALEYGLPYNEQKNLWHAVCSHVRMLKKFSERPDFVVAESPEKIFSPGH
ncbi:MAG: acyl-CoA desaturase [Parachlamydiales bacterium]|jgi:linoleoyl-CoA desaturase